MLLWYDIHWLQVQENTYDDINKISIVLHSNDLFSMELWVAAKKASSQCGGATSFRPGS